MCVLCMSWEVKAHQTDLSSTILVEQNDNTWLIQIRAALTAFEYEIHQHYGEGVYATPEEFEELVIRHVQENISIRFNETNALVLQKGLVKLGHETSVTFEVAGTPESIQSLIVKNSSFSDISRNQSALIVLKKSFSKDQFILNDSNEHAVKLKVSNAKFELVTPMEEQTQYSFLILLVICLVLTLLYFVYKNNRTNKLIRVHLPTG